MTKVLNLLGVLASLVLIVSISFEALTNATFSGDTVYTRIQLGVCLYFLLDFLLLLVAARDRWRFFSRNFILIFLSVPYAWLVHNFNEREKKRVRA